MYLLLPCQSAILPRMDRTAVRIHRARLKLTQEQLAARLGVTRVTVARWESTAANRHQIPEPTARLLQLLQPIPRP